MPPRRSHQKSHTGCITCKRRHVKCDETGPPCGRCETRGTTCEYASDTVRSRVSPPIQNQAHSAQNSEPAAAGTPTAYPTYYPDDSRRLELQLMHKWSTSTYKSCCTPGTGDDQFWQVTVPALSLQTDFLLNGLLALSAFEIAHSLKINDADKPIYEKYVKAAIEHQVLAVASFRSQLSIPSRENHRAMLCFSLMLMVLAFASVQFAPNSSSTTDEQESIVQIAITHFELIRGCVQVAESEEDYLSRNEYIQRLTRFEDLPCTVLDPPVAEVMVKLEALNDRRIVSSAALELHERRVQQTAYWEACKKALTALQECFQKCVGQVYRGYALGWLNMAGEEYIRALKANDHTALLILMLWGFLVESVGYDIWWTEEFGISLVNEISSGALNSDRDPFTRDITLQVRAMIKTLIDDRTKLQSERRSIA